MYLNEDDSAVAKFQSIANSDAVFASEGLWYEAMLHLKNGNTEKAKATLQQLQSSGKPTDRSDEIQALLKVLP